MNGPQGSPLNAQRGAVIAGNAFNGSPHSAQGADNAAHGPFLYGGVPGEFTGEGLARQDAGNQPGGRAAVAAVQNAGRFCKAVEPFSVNQDPPWILINSDSHAAEAADGGETVRSLQKMGDFRGSLSQGAQHDSPV